MDDGPALDATADLTLADRAIVFADVLVLADLHVGRGPDSNVELPVGDSTDLIERFRGLLDTHDPAEVIVAGDLLHSFRTVPRTVSDTVSTLARAAREAGARMLVTPGNHDTMLDSVWSGPVESAYRVGDTVICHGHEPPATDADRYVIGHDHPTITIEGQRRPCYLAADDAYQGADVVMLPAFNRLLRGVEINGMHAGDFMTPLVTDADRFAPIVLDEDAGATLPFPPLGEFRHRL
jgi:putative SbcD/Mre11-related phosphoesterase